MGCPSASTDGNRKRTIVLTNHDAKTVLRFLLDAQPPQDSTDCEFMTIQNTITTFVNLLDD